MPAAAVIALTLVAFLPVLGNGFIPNWDDRTNFLDNPQYRGLGTAQLRWMFTTFHAGHYIPLTWLSLGLDYLLWGLHPAGYHLTSLLLHAATALAFYFLALRLLRLALPRPPPPPPSAGAPPSPPSSSPSTPCASSPWPPRPSGAMFSPGSSTSWPCSATSRPSTTRPPRAPAPAGTA